MAMANILRSRVCRCRLLACLLLASSAAYGADGNELFALGAIQKGLGGAGVAHAYDSSWVALNPAALAELPERRLDLHFETILMGGTLQPRGLPGLINPAAGRMEDANYIFVPSASYMQPLGRGVVAMGGFGTQGNRLDYPRPALTLSLLDNGDRRSQYEVARFPLAYARHLGRGWSVGAGVVGVLARFRTDSITTRLRSAQGDNEWDVEEGFGFIAGIHKRAGRLRLGLAYESEVWMGRYEEYDQDIYFSSFNLPQSVQGGIALEVTPRLEILADYKWIDWPQVPQLGDASVRGGLGWREQEIWKAGANFRVNEKWSLRAGVSRGNAPMEADDVFANALTPGISRTHIAAGFTWRINARHEIHAALSHLVRAHAIENGRGDLFSIVGRGTEISYREDSVTLQYTWRF